MSSTGYYALRMRNIPARYKLSKNAQMMLKALEDFKTLRIDEEELGRLVRLSPNNRKAVIDTMVQCAEIMQKDPEESGICLAIIQGCGEIVKIADKPPPMTGFPSFLKLPLVIREQVYDYYLRSALPYGTLYPSTPKSSIIPAFARGTTCTCDTILDNGHPRGNGLALVSTSKRLREEVLGFFYRRMTIYFPCTCQLERHLTTNILLQQTIQTIKLHWTGKRADHGIPMLAKCPNLRNLIVVISSATTKYGNARHNELRPYHLVLDRPRLAEALGFDQLIEIRGLNRVNVQNISTRWGARRSEEEKRGLQQLLESKLLE